MLKQTFTIVSYLFISLLIGIIFTVLADSAEDATVEKNIRAMMESNIINALASFKESAVNPTSRDEESFLIKFISTVMADRLVVHNHIADKTPEPEDNDSVYLLTLNGKDYALDIYLQKTYLKSELALLDLPDYIFGILSTIVVFTFLVYFSESRKRTLLMKQQFESKQAELSSALERHEALALVGRMSASLAHELKTPLGTISNLIQALPSRRNDEQFISRFIALTSEELNRTQQLIDNLLVYGKDIEILNEEWFPIRRSLEDTVPGGIALDVQDRTMIYGDRFYLDLLFKNLVRNASEAGADKVSVTVLMSDQDASFATIIFDDNGIGFPASADLEKLTDPFVTSRSRGGGLGLYLSKKITIAHGGSLSLERKEKGARIMLAIPGKRIKT